MRKLAAPLFAAGIAPLMLVVSCSSSEPAAGEDAGDLTSDSGTTIPDAARDTAATTPETLDCAWIQSDKDCWGVALKEAAACAPGKDTVGLYSGDKSSCTYPTGESIAFAVPWSTTGRVEFTLKDKAGQPCATVLIPGGPGGEMNITTKSGPVKSVMVNFELTITCPGGRVAYTSNWQGTNFGACGFPAVGRGTRLDPRPDAAPTQIDSFSYGETKTNGVQLMLCATQ
jgi:hypothetical protein